MLTKRVQVLAPSKTMYFTAKANKLKDQGFSVMDFSVGEPDFCTPENICRAAKAAINEGYTKYTLVNGILELREAICKKLLTDNKIFYTPNQICAGTGAKQPLFNAIFALCETGDEVIIPTPSWVSYEEMVKLAGADPVFVKCREEENFELNIHDIERAVTDRTKAVIINTPNNPTGAVYGEKTLRQLGDLALQYNFYIIVDEIYEKLVYDKAKHFSIASVSEKVKNKCILINGLSKSYSMTGWRIGYAAANDEVSAAMKAIQSHTTSSGNSITQYAAVEAYNGTQEFVQSMHDEFHKRRNYLVSRIQKMPFVSCGRAPSGAFYIMLNVVRTFGREYKNIRIDSADTLADLLLMEAHIAMVSGEAFHAEDYLRICYAVSMENIARGMDRLVEFLREL